MLEIKANEEPHCKIEDIENKKLNESKPKKESGAGFAFKISTELIAALIVGVGMGLIVDLSLIHI